MLGQRHQDGRPFGDSREVLRQLTLETLRGGEAHDGIADRFDALLLLADRLVASCADTSDLGDIPRRVSETLKAASGESGRSPGVAGVDALKDCIEPFLKAVLSRAKPHAYRQRVGHTSFNLYQVVVDLDLLTK